ncbi:LysR family transcriptional regulator [Pseudomaricurvus alkylphenolicus]|uniref:LysR substrate-binding domain-containing protein n=1 Tax=Pseudomaricurvus alkylphenolicus TaxID=1306991 RepID=UPI00141E937A|nr:LysR substrate-binding domain-containing protein [Pseudomaricurvus alkylphenolicus]NIB39162.1 LysR family transcriptional regulator [Pseudomaricurvus alkylphenolicus]
MTPDKFERTLIARLKFKHLKLLVTVNEQRNIFKAAQLLNMAQPAATKIIRDLENDLEVELFERSSRGVSPTLYGDIVIKHAKLILSQVKHASEELATLKGGLAGRVTVGTLLAASAALLPNAIAQLKNERPNVSINLVEGTVDTLLGGLRIGDIDMVLGRLPKSPQDDGITSEVLYYEPVVLVARHHHPLANQKNLNLADLMDCEWILPPQTTNLRQEINRAFSNAGLEPPAKAVESVSMLANRTLLEQTDMIAALPNQVARTFERLDTLTRLPVDPGIEPGPVGVSLREGRELSPAAQYLLQKLRLVADEINQG